MHTCINIRARKHACNPFSLSLSLSSRVRHTHARSAALSYGDYQIYSLLAGGIVRAGNVTSSGERVFRHIAARNATAVK